MVFGESQRVFKQLLKMETIFLITFSRELRSTFSVVSHVNEGMS